MSRLATLALLVALAGCRTADAPASSGADAGGAAPSGERATTILANLRHEFPQLAEADVRVDSLRASEIDGLDRGVLTVNGDAQPFYVTPDGRHLLLLAVPPIDASRDADALAAARAAAEQETLAEARTRAAALARATATLPARGPAAAPVTIVEFSDFQCPYCRLASTTVEELLRRYPDDVRLVYAHFPLANHAWATPAAIAATCAAEQSGDAFWRLHDAYFANQRALTPETVVARSRQALAGAGVDLDAWQACATSTESADHRAAAAAVRAQAALGATHGVSGTPAFFVNGRFLNGNQPIEAFVAAIEAAKGDA